MAEQARKVRRLTPAHYVSMLYTAIQPMQAQHAHCNTFLKFLYSFLNLAGWNIKTSASSIRLGQEWFNGLCSLVLVMLLSISWAARLSNLMTHRQVTTTNSPYNLLLPHQVTTSSDLKDADDLNMDLLFNSSPHQLIWQQHYSHRPGYQPHSSDVGSISTLKPGHRRKVRLHIRSSPSGAGG